MGVNEIPSLIWVLVKDYFQRDAIMEVMAVNYNDTLNVREWHGEDYNDYWEVPTVRNVFSRQAELNVSVGDRVLVSFVDGDKNLPIITGVIHGVD